MQWKELEEDPKKFVAIDTETTGLNPWGSYEELGFYPARPFAVSWCYGDFRKGYAHWSVDKKTRRVRYEKKPNTYSKVKELLADSSTIKVFHNANFDILQLLNAGFQIRGLIVDTQTMAHIVTRGSRMSYALKPLAKDLFEFSDDDREALEYDVKSKRYSEKYYGTFVAEGRAFGRRPYLADFWLGDKELVKKYAIQDVERTMLLFHLFGPIIARDKNMRAVFERETKLYMGPIFSMEWRGIRVFRDDLVRLRDFYEDYIAGQRRVLNELIGPDFNPRSPKQIVAELVDKEGLRPLKLTAAGNPSCDGEFLQTYAEAEPPNEKCRAILEFTNGARCLSNFIEPYERFGLRDHTGISVLHPNIRQTTAITGRMGSSDPNMMNVASETTGRKRSFVALKPRECLGPRDGYLWYLPDYSQIEVWMFAILSGSKSMLKVLMSGHDFHGTIAKQIWSRMPDYRERREYYRKRGKLVMFSKLYGGGIKKVATLLGCSYDEAKSFVTDYEANLPEVSQFMERMIAKVRRKGYVTNVYGRSYEIDSNYAYRAVNYLIQGTAADIQKEALNNIHYNLCLGDWPDMHTLLSMHDEILLEVPIEYHSKRLMREIVVEMQKAGEKVNPPKPLPVGMKIVPPCGRWGHTTEIEL